MSEPANTLAGAAMIQMQKKVKMSLCRDEED
jgi:hypothetical protein